MLRITTLLLAVALVVSAQTPASRQPGWCAFTAPDGFSPKADIGEPDEFAIPRGDLCKHYTYGAGWDEQMVLQLGEGAEEYLEWIEMAVDVWNDALWGRKSTVHPIRISHERPANYRISSSFWEDYKASGDDVTLEQEDDENVIYFKPSSESGALGLAKVWTYTFSNEMAEADIYINTRLEKIRGGQVAEIMPLLRFSHDNVHGIYLYHHHAFITILHEIGHALGLSHVPVAGNIMSYSNWEGFREQWEAPMALHMHMLHRYSGLETIGHDFYVDRHDAHFELGNWYVPLSDERFRILTNFYSSKIRLGGMEKMLLGCSYEFDD